MRTADTIPGFGLSDMLTSAADIALQTLDVRRTVGVCAANGRERGAASPNAPLVGPIRLLLR
jgi:hypothetical protein